MTKRSGGDGGKPQQEAKRKAGESQKVTTVCVLIRGLRPGSLDDVLCFRQFFTILPADDISRERLSVMYTVRVPVKCTAPVFIHIVESVRRNQKKL